MEIAIAIAIAAVLLLIVTVGLCIGNARAAKQAKGIAQGKWKVDKKAFQPYDSYYGSECPGTLTVRNIENDEVLSLFFNHNHPDGWDLQKKLRPGDVVQFDFDSYPCEISFEDNFCEPARFLRLRAAA